MIADHKKPLDRFFAYARERHGVYLRRTAGAARPWTDEPILQQYRFTNVFRELDKTTAWYRQHVREPLDGRPEVLLATVLFRMLNRIEVGEAIFCQATMNMGAPLGSAKSSTAWDYYLHHGRTNLLKRAIVSYCGKGPYVTGAYIISSPPGMPKLDGMLQVIDWFRSQAHSCPPHNLGAGAIPHDWRDFAEILENSNGEVGLEDTFNWLGEFPYLGKFHAYEIVTDLRFTHLLRDARDINTWANMGPGAQRGLNRIHDRGDVGSWSAKIYTPQALNEMRELLRLSRDARYWPQGHKRTQKGARDAIDWPRWELRDVEHTLCEFDKFERVRLGEGRPRGVYR